MSEVGKTKDAGWNIGVSKTVERGVEEVWEYLTSAEGLACWLGKGVDELPEKGGEYETDEGVRGELRSVREHDRVRLTWRGPRHDRASGGDVGGGRTGGGEVPPGAAGGERGEGDAAGVLARGHGGGGGGVVRRGWVRGDRLLGWAQWCVWGGVVCRAARTDPNAARPTVEPSRARADSQTDSCAADARTIPRAADGRTISCAADARTIPRAADGRTISCAADARTIPRAADGRTI
ncbi:hypothetical protein AB0I28_05815, partial [Phytomonospora sp. NPDC050363]